jgi:PII-like signaling protein
MNSIGKKKILRLYIDSLNKYEHKPLWEVVLQKAKEEGLAGATVFKGIAGMGPHSEIHTFSLLSMSENLPIIVEIIDNEEKIINFTKILDEIVDEGLVTLTDTEVIQYRHKESK